MEDPVETIAGSAFAFRLLCWAGIPVVFLFLFTILRNVYLHPLRGCPGPLLSRCSSVPRDWMIYNASLQDWTKQLHKNYGPCVRIAPNELSYSSPEALDTLTRSPDGNCLQGSSVKISNLVVKKEQDAHRFYKAIDGSYPRAEQEKTIDIHLNKCLSRLQGCLSNKDALADRCIELTALLDLLFLDTESDLAFGKSFGLQDSPSLLPTSLAELNITFLRTELVAQYCGIASPLAMKVLGIDAEAQNASEVLEALAAIVMRDKSSSERASNEERVRVLTQSCIRPLTALVSGCIFYLLSMPDTQKQVINQIRSSFSSEHEISIESTRSLHRLNSAIRETLRLNPFSKPFLESGTNGAELCGERLPPGTLASVDAFVANTSPSKDPQSLEFRSERFSQDELDRIPDTYGSIFDHYLPRAQVRLTLARLLWRFSFELECISDDVFPCGPPDPDADSRDFRWADKPVHVRLLDVSHAR